MFGHRMTSHTFPKGSGGRLCADSCSARVNNFFNNTYIFRIQNHPFINMIFTKKKKKSNEKTKTPLHKVIEKLFFKLICFILLCLENYKHKKALGINFKNLNTIRNKVILICIINAKKSIYPNYYGND
jgi:hypothetical protein